MKVCAKDFWDRAKEALRAAKHCLSVSEDAAASRAYYAAFYAVSAHFALQGKTFSRHSAAEAAVHRDLVRQGGWPEQLGAGYARLAQLRHRGDYGGILHVSKADAEESLGLAAAILRAVADANPDTFTGLEQG